MTEKQKKFADEYLIDLNATRAYKAAYKNVKKDSVAAAASTRLLRNVKVSTYIQEQIEKLHSKKTADAAEVIEYLSSVMRGEQTEEVLCLAGEGTQEIEKIDVSAKDRLKAAELLGKRYSLFTDKVEVDADMDLNIKIDYGDGNEPEDTG